MIAKNRNFSMGLYLVILLLFSNICMPVLAVATTTSEYSEEIAESNNTLETLSSDTKLENITSDKSEIQENTVEPDEPAESTEKEEPALTMDGSNSDTPLPTTFDPKDPRPFFEITSIDIQGQTLNYQATVRVGTDNQSVTTIQKVTLLYKNILTEKWQEIQLSDDQIIATFEQPINELPVQLKESLEIDSDGEYEVRFLTQYQVFTQAESHIKSEGFFQWEENIIVESEENSKKQEVEIKESVEIDSSLSTDQQEGNSVTTITNKDIDTVDKEEIDIIDENQKNQNSTDNLTPTLQMNPSGNLKGIFPQIPELLDDSDREIEQNFLQNSIDTLVSFRAGQIDNMLDIANYPTQSETMPRTSQQDNRNILSISKNGEESVTVSGYFYHNYQMTTSPYSSWYGYGVVLLSRKKGETSWERIDFLSHDDVYPAEHTINSTLTGFDSAIYEFGVGIAYNRSSGTPNFYHASYFPTSGQEINLERVSKVGKPEWAENVYYGKPNPIFHVIVDYKNGATIGDVRFQVVNRKQPSVVIQEVVATGNPLYPNYAYGSFSGLQPGEEYLVRAYVKDPVFGWSGGNEWSEVYKAFSSTAAAPEWAEIANYGKPNPVFHSLVDYQHGSTYQNVRFVLVNKKQPTVTLQDVPATNNPLYPNMAYGSFSGLQPGEEYLVQVWINDPLYGWVSSEVSQSYKASSSTSSKPEWAQSVDYGRPNPTFHALMDYKYGATYQNVRFVLVNKKQPTVTLQDIPATDNPLYPNMVYGTFSGLQSGEEYLVQIYINDPLYGWVKSEISETYLAASSTVAKPSWAEANNYGHINPTFHSVKDYKFGTTSANVGYQIVEKISPGVIVQDVAGWEQAAYPKMVYGTFLSLQPNTEYLIRAYIDDPYYGRYYSEWSDPYLTRFKITEVFVESNGNYIKDQDRYVAYKQSYVTTPPNTFTHNSVAYVYSGWLKESDWDGNSATPMPALRAGNIDSLTTDGEKVYLIYDVDSDSLRLDEFPNKFDFGDKHKLQNYNQNLKLDPSKYSSTETVDGFKVRVRDERVVAVGWNLTVTLSPLVGLSNASDTLSGAKFSFGVNLQEIQNPGLPSETPIPPTSNAPSLGGIVTSSIATIPADGSSSQFLGAAIGKGAGVYDVSIDFDSVSLFLPAGQGTMGETYHGNLQWDLEDTP